MPKSTLHFHLAADLVHAQSTAARQESAYWPNELWNVQKLENSLIHQANKVSVSFIPELVRQRAKSPPSFACTEKTPVLNKLSFVPKNLNATPLVVVPKPSDSSVDSSAPAPHPATTSTPRVAPKFTYSSSSSPAPSKPAPPSKRRDKVKSYNYGSPASTPAGSNAPNDGYQSFSNEFKSAKDKLIEDQLKKTGGMPAGKPQGFHPSAVVSDTNHLNKKRKREFDSPFPGDDEMEVDSDIQIPSSKMPKLGNNAPTSGKGGSSKSKSEEKNLPPEYKGIDPELVERIENEILDHSLNVTFADIAGLAPVKQALTEMVILPAKNPQLFTGLRAPAKGLLLFGPPGNGKTLIAKAVAHEAHMTFFSISASVLCSKWIGEGEKTVKALFAVARAKQPSFIFIDEIDSILSARSQDEHESTRRLKNEFLLQFEGATTPSTGDRILVMGATNRPQDIDDAARRRLAKRIYVPLPDAAARRQMLQITLKDEKHTLTAAELERVGEMLNGYSGNDIKQVCYEAAMLALRELKLDSTSGTTTATVRPLEMSDFAVAIKNTKPTVAPDQCLFYEKWRDQFGTTS